MSHITKTIIFLPVILSLLTAHIGTTQAEGIGNNAHVMYAPITQTSVVPDGKVVYIHRGNGAGTLYIVGTSHRDALTRAGGKNTARVQSEVYGIGDWLIKNYDVELILPEGYFEKNSDGAGPETNSGKGPGFHDIRKVLLDSGSVEERLNNDLYANAEILLKERHHVIMRQVEDGKIYGDVIARICMLEKCSNAFDMMYGKTELDYLQKLRTATILQKIPGIVDHEVGNGAIRHSDAMLTIGLAHLSEIISSIEKNRLDARSPAFTPYKDYDSEVDLIKKGFNVIVIIPRTLAEDRDLMQLTHLTPGTGQVAEAHTLLR